eukprot:TRINITY_DN1529_c0_g1_i1.p1 TRINITY_DN1529_c0_g1~~TRINITY_DN1529_c0_g1_i1.p1  ORF type:complete len:435 (+),score=137.22 TRINITY_DN1529_c0_g1_i1:29-1306(+)
MLARTCSALLLLLLLAVSASAQSDNCQGTKNSQPVYTNAPEFLNSSANGMLFWNQNVTPPLYVLHMYGSPYEMGYAHGSLLKEQVNALIPELFDWVFAQMQPYISFLPPLLQKAIEELGVHGALDLTYELTQQYIPSYFMEEMRGISDGSGIPMQQVVQVMMFPELIKASCSMYGAWGDATANTGSKGALFQLRALDWSTDGPFQQFPLVLVYHPEDGHDFATLGWAGFIGALTGYSSAPIALCEKVWLAYNGTSSRSGIPWHFLTRDILQFDADINSAVSRMAGAERTCSIFIGLGDHTNQFVAVQYSHETVIVNDGFNSPTWDGHPKISDVVYVDKHKQPSSDPCLGDLLQQNYGNLDAQAAIQISALFQTGDMHIAVFDHAKKYMYVANASPVNSTGGGVIPAYDRAYVRLDMSALFAQQQK